MAPIILYILFIYFPHCYGNEILHSKFDSGHSAYKPICLNNACVLKCCPANKYVVGHRTCGENHSNYTLDFSDMQVYNERRTNNISTVDRSLIVIPAELDNIKILKKPMCISLVPDINLYVTENGHLYKEIPNFYNRWSRWERMTFCIDYYINKTAPYEKPIPRIWTSFEPPSDIEYKPYQKYADLVSCFFLLLVFIVYIVLPDLRNLGGKIVMSYVFNLFWSYVFLFMIQNYQHTNCTPLSLMTYFFFMSSFCWMNIMSFDIWWTFRGYAKTRTIHRRGELFKFIMYCLYACGLPLAMTIGLGILDYVDLKDTPWIVTPSIGKSECFLDAGSKFLYLYIPMTILILTNWLFFSLTAFNVWRLCRGTKMLNHADSSTSDAQHKQWSRFMVYLKLSVVMGLSWVFEMLSYLLPNAIWNITDMYNLFIGLAIFIIFVCKKKILKKLVKRFKCSSRNDWRRSTQNTEVVTSNFIVQQPSQYECNNSKRNSRKIKNYE